MPIPAASVVAQAIATDIGTSDPNTLTALTAICQRVLDAVRGATVTVPGEGLLAPPGTAGGPVTGASVSGSLT